MKHLLLILLFLCSASVVRAQDVIVKKDGSTVICRVVELNATEIVYKKWSDLNGSNYVMDRSLASAINYENGKRETLGEVQNQYQPHNQNDGVQQYNDRALLAIDMADMAPRLKLNSEKRTRRLGWIGGSVLTAGGLVLLAVCQDNISTYGFGDWDDKWLLPVSIMCFGGGIAWTAYFVSSANKIKRANAMFSTSLIQHRFKIGNESTLSAGVDLIKDNTIHNQTLGLGLRYNF